MNTPREDEDQARALREWQERQDSGDASCFETVIGVTLVLLLMAASVWGHHLVSYGLI